MCALPRDRLGFRLRIGVVVPSTNTIVQPEFDALRPRGVTNHVARIMIDEQPQGNDTEQRIVMERIQPDLLPAIDRVITCGPDIVVMGMSLPTFWDGIDASHRLKEQMEKRAAMPVVMGSHACLEALKRFGSIKRLALISPYQPIGNLHVERFFREAGYEVVETQSFLSPTMRAIAEVDTGGFIGMLKELAACKPDAILQAGTNLAMIDLAGEAERWLGLPVIAINAATYWHSLRTRNIDDPIYGYGRLLAEF